MIIGFVGLAGAGKDTCANLLDPEHKMYRDSFAAPLRDFVSQLFAADCYGLTEVSRKFREIPMYLTLDLPRARLAVSTLAARLGETLDESAKIQAIIWDLLQWMPSMDTPRNVMKTVGDGLRKLHRSDIWIERLKREAHPLEHTIITDVRYPNELAVCDAIINVKRHAPPAGELHDSEMMAAMIYHNDFELGAATIVTVDNTGELEATAAQIAAIKEMLK